METLDDLAISALLHNLPTDENLAEELQLQEVIASSFLSLHKSPNSVKSSAAIGDSPSSKTLISSSVASVSGEPSRTSKKALTAPGESSQSLCEICAETKDRGDMFPFATCSHAFCTDCVARHASITVKKGITRAGEGRVTVTCPGVDCVTVLDIDECRERFPGDVIELWSDAICEAMIPPAQRYYCPYRGCSEMLVKESEAMEVAECECPSCNRLFCARCKVPWHSGIGCEEYLKLKEDEREREDLMVHDLAKKMKWRRCPNCNFYVERTEGCMHMTCRCGFQFCYSCGKVYSSTHACIRS